MPDLKRRCRKSTLLPDGPIIITSARHQAVKGAQLILRNRPIVEWMIGLPVQQAEAARKISSPFQRV